MTKTKYLPILALSLTLIILAACDQLEGLSPTILSFSANPSTISEGESATLSWNVIGGVEDLDVTLTPGDVELSKTGSLQVSPSETTTYTLTAGNISRETTVTVTTGRGDDGGADDSGADDGSGGTDGTDGGAGTDGGDDGTDGGDEGYSLSAKLTASDAEAGDTFGRSLALSGEDAVIGAPDKFISENSGGTSLGAAYFFKQNGQAWREIGSDSDISLGSFASNIDLSEGRALIRAYCCVERGSSSTYYSYERDGDVWRPIETNRFGNSLDVRPGSVLNAALTGDYAVASFAGSRGGNYAGPLGTFKFRDGSWEELVRLELDGFVEEIGDESAPEGRSYDGFGRILDISETHVVASGPDNLPGSVFIFERSGDDWSEAIRLKPKTPDGKFQDVTKVAVDGKRAIVSARELFGGSTSATFGVVYIFERAEAGWIQTARLESGDSVGNDTYGQAIAISGNTIVVGSAGSSGFAGQEPLPTNRTSAFIYELNKAGWSEVECLTSSQVDRFGSAVAVSGNTVMVGAPGYSEADRFGDESIIDVFGGEPVGAVYVYRK